MADEINRKEEKVLNPITARISITFEMEDGVPNVRMPTIKYYYSDYDEDNKPYGSSVITLKPGEFSQMDLYTTFSIFQKYFISKYLGKYTKEII